MAEILQLPGRATYSATTLDALWAEAETLGEVSVEHKSYGKGRYLARIYFHTKFGAVWAKAEHDSPAVALGIAINNARELGAGVPG